METGETGRISVGAGTSDYHIVPALELPDLK
jgi:hypothetical protein